MIQYIQLIVTLEGSINRTKEEIIRSLKHLLENGFLPDQDFEIRIKEKENGK